MDVRWKLQWMSLDVDRMRTNRLREDDLCEGFSYLSLISDVRFERVLFYYAEWQKAYRPLQYDTRVKEFEAQRWGCSNTKTTKKNIIEFREGLSRSEDYSNDPLSPKLVIIDDLMRESSYDRRFFYQRQSSQESQCYSYLAKSIPSGTWPA